MNISTGFMVVQILTQIINVGFGLVLYVLEAGALYTIARRRGIHHPWLAWIPVANMWLLGCIADQYQYVVRGRNTNRRKALLVLNIVKAVLAVVMTVLLVSLLMNVFTEIMVAGNATYHIVMEFLGSSLAALCSGVLLLVVSVAEIVFQAIALYDVYTSCDPQNDALYLILSILFGITKPFLLFFGCRDKDDGMPPRKRTTVV